MRINFCYISLVLLSDFPHPTIRAKCVSLLWFLGYTFILLGWDTLCTSLVRSSKKRNWSSFIATINEITENVSFPLSQILFADNYSLHVQSVNLQRAHRFLQNSLQQMETGSLYYDIQFHSKKTKLVIFKFPPLIFNGTHTLSSTSVKFLGLHFDSKLSWVKHT